MTTLLAALVEASARAAETSSRLAKRDAIASLLRGAEPDEVEIAVAWLSGEARQGRIGVGWATLAALRGTPAAAPSLTLARRRRRARRRGRHRRQGLGRARSAKLRALFERATAAEQDFLVRLLVGELRQGALEGVMLDAIAAASGLPAADVRRAAMVTGSLRETARVAMGRGEGEGAAGLARFAVALLRPVQPMLATPADDIAGAMAQLGTAALEWKVDGARVQVHKAPLGAGSEVKVYTRALKDVTASVPEIVEALQALPARELILDGEAVALAAGGAPLPFQVTMRRFGRKLDVAAMRAELPLAVYFFDCLHVDGTSLLDLPAQERFDAARRRAAARACDPAHRHRRRRRRRRLLRRRAGARPRGHHGQGARRALRGRPARCELAQGEARAHARPRRARRRMGPWPAKGLALEPAPRCARSSDEQLGDARQDVQGHDRRDARMADARAPGARGPRATATRCG